MKKRTVKDILSERCAYRCKAYKESLTYLAILKDKASKKEALSVAKAYFKAKADRYVIEGGAIEDGELFIGTHPGVKCWAVHLKK